LFKKGEEKESDKRRIKREGKRSQKGRKQTFNHAEEKRVPTPHVRGIAFFSSIQRHIP